MKRLLILVVLLGLTSTMSAQEGKNDGQLS